MRGILKPARSRLTLPCTKVELPLSGRSLHRQATGLKSAAHAVHRCA